MDKLRKLDCDSSETEEAAVLPDEEEQELVFVLSNIGGFLLLVILGRRMVECAGIKLWLWMKDFIA